MVLLRFKSGGNKHISYAGFEGRTTMKFAALFMGIAQRQKLMAKWH